MRITGGSEAHPPLCTSGAPPLFRERQRLAQAIEHYAARFPIGYRDMRNGHPAPALRELIQEVIEAVGARPE